MKSGKDNTSKVVILITSFHPLPMGGSESQAFRLARQLSKKGMDILVLALGGKDAVREEVIDGVRVHRLYSPLTAPLLSSGKKTSADRKVKIEYEPGNQDNFKVTGRKSILSFVPYFVFLFQTWRLLKQRKYKPSVIYVPIMEWTAFIGTLLAKAVKAKVFIKDSTVNGITNLLRYPFGRVIQKFVVKRGNFVAMTSAIEKNYRAAGVSPARIFRIPNGVSIGAPRDEQNINRQSFVFVGNLYQQPAKGVDVLLKAWRFVHHQMPELKLIVVGDGHSSQYDDYADELGIRDSVRFVGKQSDVSRYLSESYAFILPSRREGMSNALLEAMAFGMPVIATAISGSEDLVDDGRNGYLVPVENEHALAKAILQLHADPTRALEMGRNARRTIEDGYTLDIVAEKYFHLFSHRQ